MPVKITKKPVQISATSRVPSSGPAFKALRRELGPERMAQVDSMWLNGQQGAAIAKTIKGEWGLMQDMTLKVLGVTINRYCTSNLKGKLVRVEKGDEVALAKFAEKVDVLESLTRLIEMQQERVSKGYELEKNHLTLSFTLKFEVQTLAAMYRQMSDLQMDMGLIRKVPAKFQVEGMATRTQQLLEQAMKKSEKVDEALTRAYAVLEGKFKVVVPNVQPRKH